MSWLKRPICITLAAAVTAPNLVSLSEGKTGNTEPMKAATYVVTWLSTGDTGAAHAGDGSRYALAAVTGRIIRQAPSIRRPSMIQNDTGD